MTVCIAAICNVGQETGPVIVAAADRMITIGHLEYEPAQTKMTALASKTIGLFAGDMTLHATVIPRATKRVTEAVQETGFVTVEQIAEFYAEEFAFYRRSIAERAILMPRGMDFDRYLARQATMAHYQVERLDDQLSAYYIDSTAIIAGLDQTGAHLYIVRDPGQALCFDAPGFVTTGAGADVSRTQFMVAGFEKSWLPPGALWLAFTAKARAELAGGVGKQTDVLAISQSPPHIHPISDEERAMFYRMFEVQLTKEREAFSEPVKEIAKVLDEAAKKKIEATDTSQTTTDESTPSPATEKDD